ncbi:MAG TPA: hypothetical protein VG452_01615 [Egibacteraceae bacterium]|nr:hypothetical protein [Actinomycetota bacterium]HWB70887.1 hypothetical protein [Egibacteraceae bacterium]
MRKPTAVLVALAVVGEAGHRLLVQLDQAVAHHLFHVVFGAGAGVAFVGLVVVDIARNGWPSFSWRLRSEPASRRDVVAEPTEPGPKLAPSAVKGLR